MTKKSTKKPPEKEGPTYSKDTMFLRIHAGSATTEDGTVYELSTNVDGSPIIRNGTTGRWWAPGWARLITQARQEGIDRC
jgi:hypothetical protein